jgi:hypothetical protein
MEVWPADLPNRLTTDAYGEELGDGRIATPVDRGPPKMRRRSSFMPDKLTGVMVIPIDDVPTVKNFFKTVTMSGTLPFIFPHQQYDNIGMLTRFQAESAPKFEYFTPYERRVTLELEVLEENYFAFGTQPSPFAFNDVTAAAGALVTSNPVTITGFIDSLTAVVVNGELSVNGRTFLVDAQDVVAGDTVMVRGSANSVPGAKTDVILTIGTMSDTFTILTASADTSPEAFSFAPTTGVALNTQVQSNAISVAGIDAASDLTVSGGEYSINGGNWKSVNGLVLPGDSVILRATSASVYLTSIVVSLIIGGVRGDWTITTKDAPPATDTTPDQFTFAPVSGVVAGSVTLSNQVTITGINSPATVAIAGGEYQVNGGGWTTASGTLVNGDIVKVRVTSSTESAGVVIATLTVGGVSGQFKVTTATAGIDTTPDQFTLTALTNVTVGSLVQSNAITVTGINAPSAISVQNGSYQVNNGLWITSQTTVNAGDVVRVRHNASTLYATSVSTVLSIGGVSATFTSTTEAVDTQPNPFTFTDVVNANLSTIYTSNTVTITGINSPANLTITGGEYSKNGGGWTTIATTVQSGDTVQARLTSASTYGTSLTAFVTIGGVTDGFDVKTLPQLDFTLSTTSLQSAPAADQDVATIIDTTPSS